MRRLILESHCRDFFKYCDFDLETREVVEIVLREEKKDENSSGNVIGNRFCFVFKNLFGVMYLLRS